MTKIKVGQMLAWGNPAFSETGIVRSMSQNGKILFVERLHRFGKPKYETVELREVLHVVEVPNDELQQ